MRFEWGLTKFIRKIEKIKSAEKLDEIKDSFLDKNIMPIFWKAYNDALYGENAITKKKGIAKCRYIALMYSASIPISKNINKFKTPHALRGMAISRYAKIGKNCTIFQNVTIGSNTIEGSKTAGFPIIGDNVFIGAGAAIIGNVKVGSNVRIGANCIVVEDVPDNSIVVMDKPRIITKDEPLVNNFISATEFKKNTI